VTFNVPLVLITAKNGLHVQCACSEKSCSVYKNLDRMSEKLSRFVHPVSLLSGACCAMGTSKHSHISPVRTSSAVPFSVLLLIPMCMVKIFACDLSEKNVLSIAGYASQQSTFESPSLRVVQVMSKSKVLVKVHPEGKYVVDLDPKLDVSKIVTGARVALKNDSYTLHHLLPTKVDPLVSLMKVEKVPDSTYDMVGGLDQQIREIKEVCVKIQSQQCATLNGSVLPD
jgi:hypothetical protein